MESTRPARPAINVRELVQIGTDTIGGAVYETQYLSASLADAHAAAQDRIAATGAPLTLLWNGIPFRCFAGMSFLDFVVAREMAADARRAQGAWPRQILPFTPEYDPFVVNRTPAVEDEGGEEQAAAVGGSPS